MKQVKIQEEIGKVQNELTKYGLMTPGKGIDFPVSISIEMMENDRDKMVPHIVAKWKETSKEVNATKDGWVFVEKVTFKSEEMDRYFCGELFAKGITQRAAWIKADHKDRVAFLKENPFSHPAIFPVWLESLKVA